MVISELMPDASFTGGQGLEGMPIGFLVPPGPPLALVLTSVKPDRGDMAGRDVELLLSIRATKDILGRSNGSCWTQSNPMWMRLNTSSIEQPSVKLLSIIFTTFPFSQCRQICGKNISDVVKLWRSSSQRNVKVDG